MTRRELKNMSAHVVCEPAAEATAKDEALTRAESEPVREQLAKAFAAAAVVRPLPAAGAQKADRKDDVV
jgi:hypothetical protein